MAAFLLLSMRRAKRFLFDALIFCLLDYEFVLFVQPAIATTRREVRARRNPPSTETGRI